MEPKKKILIADDELEIVQILKNFLEVNFPSLAIFSASDGVQVMQNLEKIEFDILFLDLNISKFDGRKIVKEINFLGKKNRPHNIFIISGGEMSMNDVQLTGEKRNIYYFSKPLNLEKIKNQLTLILNPPKEPSVKPALEVKFMNPFIDSTINVLKITTGTDAVKEEINVSMGEAFKGDISAFYPIHSPVFQGFFCLSFPKETYLKIMSKLLYTDFDEINEENRDGVGELCNQIFGNAKAFFNDKLKTQIQMSTPSITIGENHSIISVLKAPRIVVKFSTDSGHFFVEVSFQRVG
jgi:chemotaxis protein CheX